MTALDSPWADRENPAASAAQQRTVLDAGYTALTDFGNGQGFGSAAALGLSIPEPYAVWSAGLDYVSTPSSMTALPFGTALGIRGGIAKDLFPNFFVGSAIDLTLGDQGWGAGLDLGIMQLARRHGASSRTCAGAPCSSGLGKSYSDALTPPFTLSAGMRAFIVRTDDWRIGLGADISLPTFQDLGFDLSAGISYRGVVTLRANWDQDLRELMTGSNKSLLPAFGLSAVIPLEARPLRFLPREAGLGPGRAAARRGGGPAVRRRLGLGRRRDHAPWRHRQYASQDRRDHSRPRSGARAYISPNNDGIQDTLEIPVKITDRRYVVGWTLSIANDKGEVVRKISNKESRPETQGLKGFMDRLTYVKEGRAYTRKARLERRRRLRRRSCPTATIPPPSRR